MLIPTLMPTVTRSSVLRAAQLVAPRARLTLFEIAPGRLRLVARLQWWIVLLTLGLARACTARRIRAALENRTAVGVDIDVVCY